MSLITRNQFSVIPFCFGDDFSELFVFLAKSTFLSFYQEYLSNKKFISKSNICGLILKDTSSNSIIGSTLLIIHDENNLVVGNISCTYIDENHRGHGLSSLLINETKKYCDVVTNLTPVDSIISLFKTNVSDFHPISNYQLWMRPRCNKKMLKQIEYSFVFDEIDENIKNNLKNGIKFISIVKPSELVVGFYSFKRKGIMMTEIVYVSNPSEFRANINLIFSILKKHLKANIVSCDSIFFGNQNFPDKKIYKNGKSIKFYLRNLYIVFFKRKIYLTNRKYYWIKNNIVWKPNYLSTELCFYK